MGVGKYFEFYWIFREAPLLKRYFAHSHSSVSVTNNCNRGDSVKKKTNSVIALFLRWQILSALSSCFQRILLRHRKGSQTSA